MPYRKGLIAAAAAVSAKGDRLLRRSQALAHARILLASLKGGPKDGVIRQRDRRVESAKTLSAFGALLALLLWSGGAALAQVVWEGSATSHNTPTTSLIVDTPTEAIEGDLLLAQILFLKGRDITISVVPGGWQLVRRDDRSTDIGSAIYYKFAGAAEPATYTWGFSQAVSAVGGILAYSGVDPINPIIASDGRGGDSGHLVAPSIDAVADSKLVAFFGIKKRTSLSTPAGMSERYIHENPGDEVKAKAADQDLTAEGPTGNRTSSPGSSDKWVAQLIALRAAIPDEPEPIVLYLHNNPTPPNGNTTRQANLPLNETAPSVATLFNYDTNGDSAPGRLIQKDAQGATQTDLTKYQNWRAQAPAESLELFGDVQLVFFSGIKDFTTSSGQRTKRGVVRAFLRDCPTLTSTSCTLIASGFLNQVASGFLNQASWHGGLNQWMEYAISFPDLDYAVLGGRFLELKLTVGDSSATGTSDDDMWFAYDTVDHKSRLILP
jgi:hypothetical protein